MAHVLIFLFFLSFLFFVPVWNPEKKFAVMWRKYHRVFRKTLSFVSLVRHITLIYKAKLISPRPKISRKDQKGERKEKEREREKSEEEGSEKNILNNLLRIFIESLKLDLCWNKVHKRSKSNDVFSLSISPFKNKYQKREIILLTNYSLSHRHL